MPTHTTANKCEGKVSATGGGGAGRQAGWRLQRKCGSSSSAWAKQRCRAPPAGAPATLRLQPRSRAAVQASLRSCSPACCSTATRSPRLPTTPCPTPLLPQVFTVEMHHKRVDKAGPGDNVGMNIKGLDKGNMPRTGDVMILKSDATLKQVKDFTAQIQTLDIPGEVGGQLAGGKGRLWLGAGGSCQLWLAVSRTATAAAAPAAAPDDRCSRPPEPPPLLQVKAGYSPIGFVRCGRSACRITGINWKVRALGWRCLPAVRLASGWPGGTAERQAAWADGPSSTAVPAATPHASPLLLHLRSPSPPLPLPPPPPPPPNNRWARRLAARSWRPPTA